MPKVQHYSVQQQNNHMLPNQWDMIVFVILFGAIVTLGWGVAQMVQPYVVGDHLPISLDPAGLPGYSARTVARMLIGLLLSLLFTFTIAPLAAKNKRAEKVIIPFVDIMQSVPILGFLTVAVILFLPLFPGSLMGPECAAIFAIFTSQVWNMTLSFYQSIKLLPKDMREVAAMLKLDAWQTFWRVEVPYAMPSLLWNMMISMSAGWFYVVASEAISVANQNIHLPGIGSYIHLAVLQDNSQAIGYAIAAMLVVILLYDQLLFRPLLAWTSRFRAEIQDESLDSDAWFLTWLQRARALKATLPLTERLKDWFVNGLPRPRSFKAPPLQKMQKALAWTSFLIWQISIVGGTALGSCVLIYFVYMHFTVQEIQSVFFLGTITGLKVGISVLLSSLIWVPIGVWVSLRPRVAFVAQTLAQFFASFPANIVYPLIFGLIIHYNMNLEWWTIPLMMLGTQWYILFNVIAGMSTIPKEMHLAAKNYGLAGGLWWKRFILPAIFPYYVTGAMAAAGGCWNASIVAEIIEAGSVTLMATGLGSYHKHFATLGDFPRIVLSITVMCFYVMLLNRLLWDKLYQLAENRYSMDS